MSHSLKMVRLRRTGAGERTDAAESYEFVVPVDGHDRLDTWMWHQERGACTVKRVSSGKVQRVGILTERHDGMWAFSYGVSDAEDELLPRFNAKPFVVGRTVAVVAASERSADFEITEIGPAIVKD